MRRIPVSALERYPAADRAAVRALLAQQLQAWGRKIVVLDDDPTGIQTVHHVSVYTDWGRQALAEGFAEPTSLFYVLTNSRSFSAEATRRVHREIGESLCVVAAEQGKDFTVISRGDSTLRGHYPLETEALCQGIEKYSGKRFDGEVILPFFAEGGRYTIDNIHYVRAGDELVPVGETEFAKDKTFGYHSSHLGDYIEEKTGGRYRRDDCTYITLEDLRCGGSGRVADKLMAVRGFGKVIVNAVDYLDVERFAVAYLETTAKGKEFLFRSAAALPRVLGGISGQPCLRREQIVDAGNPNGGVVLAGSHVKKTTEQLEALQACVPPLCFLEFDQHRVAESGGLEEEVRRIVPVLEERLLEGQTVVIRTRRERFDLPAGDAEAQLRVSTQISDALTDVVARLSVRPRFLLTKGGITSSDVGTRAMGVKRAVVMGQIAPGIPVWDTGERSKFPHIPLIIFPGNVGNAETLREIVEMLAR